MRDTIATYFQQLQDTICQALETADGLGKFKEDKWEHHSGGGGRSRVLENGNIIEKGGVNFSAVQGQTSEALMRQMNLTEQADYFATGVSIVMHPNSPKVPIIHMNVRYFEMSNGVSWFGGGIDLTPHYVVEEDARWFHQQLKATCDKHDPDYYPRFKKWADDYFYIPHRQETRGVGGIFFDYQKSEDKESLFRFVQAVGETFAPTYTHLMLKNKDIPFTEAEKEWQLVRRGRYAEFNLAWDRGTKFGLETGGRTESILMSLPPLARWIYDYHPLPDTPEGQTILLLKKGIEWA
ncbi:oxygen-dependent coproporphyrinogen oxidase [Runella sp. CRIBMP]|uniref:oxygen-dependent coproporphyrinogen oxidase n=1 Tax=Runella sp. CRIBMP TaxID=2683261 RepID=UPI001412A66F|nr:oxygen-dependent coproporphyrinogen oxidase [Runella sp. CRIBMP]NBB18903.1 oxygen-dependent coproporphyrinogen oxidase [Runella sp. CRIBMP]